jgi:hypothetical protein
MTFSDALPVQFWLNGQETFNEKVVDGVHHFCFSQPFECDDEIKIQFKDNTANEYRLKLINYDGLVVHDFEFINIYDTIWSVTFIPSDYSPDLCDDVVYFQITKRTTTTTDYNFLTNLDGWTNQGAGSNWAWSSEYSGSAKANTNGLSRLLELNSALLNNDYLITVDFFMAGDNPSITFRLKDLGGSIIFAQTDNSTGEGSFSYSIPSSIASQTVYTDIFSSDTGGGITGITNIKRVRYQSLGSYEVIAYSDCINIASTHKETILITYSNHRNFADLDNLAVSPDPEYQIRIPAVFVEERFPEEQEVIELSNSTSVQTFAQIKAQKLLRIGPMPFYMHRKLKLILSHQFITIDDTDYVKQEAYEIIEGNRRYPLRQAQCWLTEKNYIKRNIL